MIVPNKNICGKTIARLRNEADLTQDQLSARLAREGLTLDRAAIAKIETGIRRVYDYELVALAKVLGVALGELFEAPTSRHARGV